MDEAFYRSIYIQALSKTKIGKYDDYPLNTLQEEKRKENSAQR